VVIRPSGTEPKLKCYLQIVTPPTGLERLDTERAATEEAMGRLRAEVAGLVGLPG
jgi:phosphomannomutase